MDKDMILKRLAEVTQVKEQQIAEINVTIGQEREIRKWITELDKSTTPVPQEILPHEPPPVAA